MNTEEKQSYEITFVMEEENNFEVRKIIERHEGVIRNEKAPQKFRLAYPIKKQNFGFAGILKFETLPEKIKNIMSDLKLTKSILRYIIEKIDTRVPEPKKVKVEEASPVVARVSSERAGGGVSTRSDVKKSSVLTNEDIEKKIEEILQ